MAGYGGFQTLFQIDPAGGTAYVTVGEVTSISGPNMDRSMIDVTSMDSSGGWRQFVPGLIDGGEVTIECNMHPTNTTQQNMSDQFVVSPDGLLQTSAPAFNIVWPDNTAWPFDGWVQSHAPTAGIDDPLKWSFTVKLTGSVTLPT